MKRSITIILALSLFLTLNISAAGLAPSINGHGDTSSLLQLAAGNHVLGFDSRGVYAAGGDHALRVDFVRANDVQPQTDSGDAFRRVAYAGLWEGISLEYASLADGLYMTTYTLAPGAKAKQIRLRYNAPVTLNENGTLTIAFESGAFTESAPIAWQEIRGQRVPVDVAFRVRGREVGFALGAYDPRYGVTIDPSIVWNTFLGSASLDWNYGLARDDSGNLYVTGYSSATWGSPVRAFTAGANDCFVAKLNSSGSLLWNTFLGSSGSDECRDIVYNGSEILVVGYSNATWGSPVRAYSSGNDTMVVKLNASSGALTWNTFLGGSGADYGRGISFANPGGYVYVSGYSNATWGTAPKRTYTSGNDGYAAKLDSSGALVWHAFLGGSGDDYGRDIYALSAYAIYTVGYSNATWGAPTISYTANNDAYIALLDYNGLMSWHSFLGGSGDDYGVAIHVHSAGSEYVLGGSTATWGVPVRGFSGVDSEVFIAKVGASGTLTWNTFLGGGASDTGYAITADSSGNVYAAGNSAATWGSPLGAYAGAGDAFVAKIDSSGGLVENTFVGSAAAYDTAHGIAVDSSGDTYVSGASAATWGSPVNPFTADAVFAAKVDVQRPTVSSFSFLDSNPTNQTSVEYQVNFSEPVTDVLIADFGLSTSGLSFASITAVGCGGSTCTVYVNTGSGSGTLHLRLMGWATIYDVSGNAMTDLPYMNGPTYTVDKTAPTVTSITRDDPSPTTASNLNYTVTFSEAMPWVATSHFSLTTTGSISGASVTGVSGSGATRTVTIARGSGGGTIRLDMTASSPPTDSAGNAVSNVPYTSGEVYVIPEILSLTLRSQGINDGWTLESTETSNVGGSKDNTATTFRLGDDASNRQYRTILSFNTASLPDIAVITKVTLKIKRSGAPVGTNPFTILGKLLVDTRKPYFGGSVGLAISDFQAAAGKSNIGFIPNAPVNNWYTKVWSTDTFFSHINLTGSTQFRLRFTTDDNNDNGADFISFFSGNYATASARPTLIIEYYVP